MKTNHNKLIPLIVLSGLIGLGNVSANSHRSAGDAEAVLEATRTFNGTANRAEWEEHFSMFALGCTGFWEAGMIRTNKETQQNIENHIRNQTEWTKNGGKRRVFIRHPEVAMHGDVAVVTCYMHGWYQSPEEERKNVLDCVTLIWKKTDDGWKIVHEHFSEMKKDW